MATNPNNAIGTNAAYSGRTSPNAFNDVLAMFTGRGILKGWEVLPSNNMVITLGGQSGVRDVAIAEDNAGNKITINNISQQPVEVEIQAASTTSASTDYIVAYVNNPPEGQALLADNPGACGLIDVRGSGNLAPTEEQIRASITADGGSGTTAYYVVLATISIPIAATTITATNITQGAKSHSVDWATSMPVGSVYVSVNEINPSIYFGGTWETFAKGKTLIGVDPDDIDFNVSQKTGGEKAHILKSNELFEDAWVANSAPAGGDSAYKTNGSINSGSFWGAHTGLKNQQPINNLQPYITVYMWVRTA